MVKRKPVEWRKVGEKLSKVAEITKAVLQNHPAAIGLGIMAFSAISTAVVQASIPPGSPTNDRVRHSWESQMTGLYQGTQSVVLALAAVPIITAVAGAAAQFAPVPKAQE